MTISFTNIWKDKIIDPIKSFIRDEFGGQVNIYISDEYEMHGNCSLRIHGLDQSIEHNDNGGFTNEYRVELAYYLLVSNYNETAMDKLYRDVARLEQLLYNKANPSGRGEASGSHKFYDGKVSSIGINEKTEAELSVDNLLTAKIEYVCLYTKVS